MMQTNDRLTHHAAARGLFLVAALLSFALSVFLFFGGDESEGIFVGLWVPSILALGVFLAPGRAADRGPAAEEVGVEASER